MSFVISLADPMGEDWQDAMDIDYSLVFNSATNNFRFTYTDNEGVGSQYCLKTYKMSGGSQNLLNTTCLTSSSGSILHSITVVNGTTYISKAFTTIEGTDYLIDSVSKSFKIVNDNPLWLYLVMLLTIVFATSAIWSLKGFLLLTPLPLFLASITGIIMIDPVIIGGIYAVFIIISFTINK